MNSALRVVAASLGISAGLAGLEHGIFEILQANVTPAGVMFASIGAPCEPEMIWHRCEPAMSIIPNFLISGVITLVLSLVVLIWSAAFVQRKGGGTMLMLLCVPFLLFGGGIFPPVIGLIGGAIGSRIGTPLRWWRRRFSGAVGRFFASLHPAVLIFYMVWALAGQWLVGHFFNRFMIDNAGLALVVLLSSIVIALLAGFAHEVQHTEPALINPQLGQKLTGKA